MAGSGLRPSPPRRPDPRPPAAQLRPGRLASVLRQIAFVAGVVAWFLLLAVVAVGCGLWLVYLTNS
jgi:hypothetical protein